MYAVVMAGGRGTRFWPASRHSRPKQFLPVIGTRTLLQCTIDRILPLTPPEQILIVSGKDLYPEIKRQLPVIPDDNILLEPEGRNTAPCIGWAALHIAHLAGDDVMVVLPADHFITREERFLTILKAACMHAARQDCLVTLAIPPSRPETGFGYLQLGHPTTQSCGEPVCPVVSFTEKPDEQKAEYFIRQGSFYWNSGIFIWKASTILRAFEKYIPKIHAGLHAMHGSLRAGNRTKAESIFLQIEPISVDYGVMEKASPVYALLGDMGWSDVGSWISIYELNPKDAHANVVRGEWVQIDTEGCLIECTQKLVATIGLRNLIIVDTGDALLVCPMDRAQEVRHIVEQLRNKGKIDFL